jgi:hypothetical protein
VCVCVMYVCMYVCEYVCMYLCIANVSNWNKALWTPDVIYYHFSGDWNVLVKFHYFTINGDIFIHVHFEM